MWLKKFVKENRRMKKVQLSYAKGQQKTKSFYVDMRTRIVLKKTAVMKTNKYCFGIILCVLIPESCWYLQVPS